MKTTLMRKASPNEIQREIKGGAFLGTFLCFRD